MNLTRTIKIFILILLCLTMLGSTPPVGIIFTYTIFHEYKNKIRKIIIKWSPNTETIGENLAQRYSEPKTLFFLATSSIATIIGFILLISHLRTQETTDYINYIFIQATITGFFASGVLGIAWILLSLNTIFEGLLAKIWVSLLVSACIIFSRLTAVDFFSGTFPFPPAYMPFSFGLATLIFAFSFSAFAFSGLAIIFEFILIIFLLIFNFKNKLKLTISLFFISSIGFTGSWAASFAMIQGLSNKGPLFMIKAAEKYDFTKNHMCQATENESVLFIENVSDRAIAATFPLSEEKVISPRNISKAILDAHLPKNFRTVRCNPLSDQGKGPGWCKHSKGYGFCDAADTTEN